MKIVVNGQTKSAEEGLTIAGLLASHGVANERVAVELNGVILRRDEFHAAEVKDGDTIEVVRFVGGG